MSGAFTVAVEGATLCGEARGEDPALVFLHGFGSSRAGWDRVWAALQPALAALRYDLRGFGESFADESLPFSHADDLLALLDARGIARATLVGLSLGGAITARFAIDHPRRVDRLVLVSPALTGWEWSEEWRRGWLALRAAARRGDMARARKLWWEHSLFETTRASDAAEDLRAAIAAFAGRQWVTDPQREVLPDLERLHTIEAPTLLLTGERDLPDFRLIAELLAAAVPRIERIDYADAGHMLPLERPREVAAMIGRFLQAPSP